MHVDMWHTVIQCTIVLGLSLKDTHPYPNTLPIQSLPRVDFWVFHLRKLTPFLIRLSQTFTFYHYFIIHFSISCNFLTILNFFTQPWCIWNAMRLVIIIHKYQRKFSLIQTSIKLSFKPKFHLFSTISIILITKHNNFP